MPSDLNAWRAAHTDLAALEVAPAPLAAAAAYVARWPDFPPDYFADRRRELARRAFDHGDGWACRLLSSVQTVAHFSLHAEHLELDRGAAEPHLLFDRANVRRWKAAIVAAFKGPCRWRLELGDAGRIHAHVLADLADGPPEIPRGGELAKACEHYFETAVRYQLKPPLEYSAANLAIWITAKRHGRLPRLSGSRGIPQKRTWGNPSRLRVSFAFSPQTNAAVTRGTPAPETDPRPLSASLSQHPHHRTPSISPRTSKPSKPSQKRVVGEERTDSAVRQESRERCYRLVQLSSFESLGEFTNRARPEPRDEVGHRQPRERGPPPDLASPPLNPLAKRSTKMNEQEQLAEMLDRLRRLIAKSHARSHTAEQARNLITSVMSPSCPLSMAQKLRTVRDTLRSYKDGIQYSDPILYTPDTWKKEP